MADVLTAPFAVAALVLIVAGVAKLRAPAPAAAAMRELGLPTAALATRLFAAFEIAPAAVWPPHGLLERPAGQAVVLMIGIAASAYATVLAYTQLPAAWSAWSAR